MITQLFLTNLVLVVTFLFFNQWLIRVAEREWYKKNRLPQIVIGLWTLASVLSLPGYFIAYVWGQL